MTIAACKLCPWNVDFAQGDAAAQRGLENHVQLRHPAAAPVQPVTVPGEDWQMSQLSSVDWEFAALDAIAEQPAEKTFTFWEVTKHLPEPPVATSRKKVTDHAKHLGMIVSVGGAPSKRPGTNASMTTLWRRTHANPVRERRTG